MDGIINIYKEKGYTSFDVVAKLRGILKMKKIGHTGTLDPDAEGVLPVCIGSATKLCDMLTDRSKEYLAVLRLGIVTDTQDMTGTVLQSKEAVSDEALVKQAVLSFVGEYDQIPPMYSALKVNGQKLCDMARQGKEIERKPRRVTIHKLEIMEMELPLVTMRVHCSKGTYIRTLCHDIGQKLGCGGCMQSLVRTRVSEFTLDKALTLSQIESLRDGGRLAECIHPVDMVFSAFPAFRVRPEAQRLLDNGNPLKAGQTVCVERGTAGNLKPGGIASTADKYAGEDANACAGEAANAYAGEAANAYIAGTYTAEVNDKDAAGAQSALPVDGGQVRMYHSDGRFCGIYVFQAQSLMLKPVMIFAF